MTNEKSGLSGFWEERWHPLREEWVVVAAHRQDRPWTGEVTAHRAEQKPRYSPSCYLCPGNTRAAGHKNPAYDGTFVFDNDYPCVGADAPEPPAAPPWPYRSQRAEGIARVVCFSPRHDLSLADLDPAQIAEVLGVFGEQTRELGSRSGIKHVLCFENKGEVVGVSNPHPHGQIYATNFVFKTIEVELAASARHLAETGRGLFEDILRAEQEDGRRILYQDEHAVSFVPYFARYAYEVYVAPKRRIGHLFALRDEELASLAKAVKDTTARFDRLFGIPFPYVMPIHQAPADGGDYRAFHAFIAFHPPLRRANLLKYLAGPEIGGGNFLSDTLPEAKARELQTVM